MGRFDFEKLTYFRVFLGMFQGLITFNSNVFKKIQGNFGNIPCLLFPQKSKK